MNTVAAALGAVLLFAASAAAEPQPVRIAAPKGPLTVSAVMSWHEQIVGASHQMCRHTLAPTEQDWRTRRACVRSTVDEAISQSGAPELAAVHAALPEPERYTPLLSARRNAMLRDPSPLLASMR